MSLWGLGRRALLYAATVALGTTLAGAAGRILFEDARVEAVGLQGEEIRGVFLEQAAVQRLAEDLARARDLSADEIRRRIEAAGLPVPSPGGRDGDRGDSEPGMVHDNGCQPSKPERPPREPWVWKGRDTSIRGSGPYVLQ